jgi:hypothetical protein
MQFPLVVTQPFVQENSEEQTGSQKMKTLFKKISRKKNSQKNENIIQENIKKKKIHKNEWMEEKTSLRLKLALGKLLNVTKIN